jgi:hypothetical protein
MMWGLKFSGPPRGMDADEALGWALVALVGYWVWSVAYPWVGREVQRILWQQGW